jgi:signal transduction histidine kinase
MQVTLTEQTSERELRAVMQDSLEETSHVVSLLQRFLDASEAESGAVSLNRRSVPVEELYTGVVEAYRVAAEERNIEIRCEEPATGASDDASNGAYVDPVRVRQALGNLLDNAVKFSPDDATIVFRVEHTPDSLQFSISDEGPGIPPARLSRIWNARARAEHDDGGSASGYGLGLTIVRAVAEAHGGSVDVRSREGKGSTFLLRLPLEAGEARTASAAASLHASDT